MKHPILGNRVWLIIWWLAWLVLALGQALLSYLAYGSINTTRITDSVVSMLVFSGLALALWFPFTYFNSGDSKKMSLVSNLTLTGAITVTLWILISQLLMSLIFPEGGQFNVYWRDTLPLRGGTGIFIYCLVLLCYYLVVSLSKLSERKAQEAKLESIVKETELRLLRSQINPHFLFNSLNSISSLTITDPERARNMIVKLSEFMRYALSRKDEQPVPLRNELENIMLYLEIEKVRFGDKLTTEEIIEEKCLDYRIPVLLLQPLYENAVKHGVYESTESVKIITSARFIEDYIEIAVSNNYSSGPSYRTGTGTGLSNVARRVELFYGNKGSVRTFREDGLFRVILYLPLKA